MKKSVHEIYTECKDKNLTDKDFINRLKEEGIIKPKKEKLTGIQEIRIINAINKISEFHFFPIKIERIKDKKFKKDFGFDELNFVEFVMEIEKLFEISLPDDKLNHVKTVNDFVELVENQL